jgi:hypothetical protein
VRELLEGAANSVVLKASAVSRAPASLALLHSAELRGVISTTALALSANRFEEVLPGLFKPVLVGLRRIVQVLPNTLDIVACDRELRVHGNRPCEVTHRIRAPLLVAQPRVEHPAAFNTLDFVL